MTNSPLSWRKLLRAVAAGGLTGKVLWFAAVAAFASFAHAQTLATFPHRTAR